MYRSLVPLIAAGLLAAAAPAAHAEVNRSFDFRTPVFVNDGTGPHLGPGQLQVRPPGGPHRPAQRRVPRRTASAPTWTSSRTWRASGSDLRYTAKDIGGCKDKDGIAYSFDIRSSSRKITSLSLKLYECDTDGVCGGYGNEKYVSFDNPY